MPSDGLVVSGDPERLRQALANALAEVVADAGALEYVSINVRARGPDAIVTISAAMPATGSRIVGGEQLRLSLQLARLLMAAMDGSVLVERAARGNGTRMTIRVPNAPAAAAPLGPTPAPTAR